VSTMTIREKVKRITDMQNRLVSELQHLQSKCPHHKTEGEYESSDSDCFTNREFWINVKCLDCTKRYMIDSVKDEERYYTFTGKVVRR
jgi:hypothetical protein